MDVTSEIGYAEWGVGFFRQAVSAQRVLAGVNVLSGQAIDVGPMGVGPGRIAKVTARGVIGTAVGHRVNDDPVAFHVRLPVSLDFALDLGMDVHRFVAEIQIPLVITARARADLAIVLDIDPPRAADVTVHLTARGLRAAVTKHAAGVEGELRRFVSKYVARELDKDYVMAARLIDVSGAIDRAMQTLGPRSPGAERMTSDLPGALADEIRQQEEIFTDPDLLRP
ncbi:MAG: hypothetical protein F2667_13115 [Actinobacteria bacterium]|uniref:Unannotated protein n=1 Tax=freshwater metagenome TaxID=449393 RepID=A0A6J6S4M1_9ZZZZ|nr:hypothetical protein [Actinomycetota bacterium]